MPSVPKQRVNRRRKYSPLEQTRHFLAAWVIGYYHIIYYGITQSKRDTARALLQLLRILKFATVGISVALIGYAMLYVLTDIVGLPGRTAYLIDATLSVELNFLGSRYVTWRAQSSQTKFWASWRRFHGARGVTFAINQVLFTIQVWLFQNWSGFFNFWYHEFYYGYLLANTACIIVSMSFNYTANDEYVFSRADDETTDHIDVETIPTPQVAIVVPCKDNDLAPLLRCLLTQDYVLRYPGLVRIVFVGNEDDKSWKSISFDDSRWPESLLRLCEISVILTDNRDANAKRLRGLEYVHPNLKGTDVIWYLDADEEPPPNLLSRIIYRLLGLEYGVVAGPVPSRANERTGFWNLFIDTSGGKTPYWPHPYVLTRENVGLNKMPVTANVAMQARVIRDPEIDGPNKDFVNSFEDYEWMFRILRRYYHILCDPALTSPREHRVGFKALFKEYFRSGKGSADYIARHIHRNHYRVWTLLRLNAVPVGLITVLYGVFWAPAATLILSIAVVLSRVLGMVVRLRVLGPSPKRFLYPLAFVPLAALYALCVVYGNAWRFYQHGRTRIPSETTVGKLRVYTYSQIRSRLRKKANRGQDQVPSSQ